MAWDFEVEEREARARTRYAPPPPPPPTAEEWVNTPPRTPPPPPSAKEWTSTPMTPAPPPSRITPPFGPQQPAPQDPLSIMYQELLRAGVHPNDIPDVIRRTVEHVRTPRDAAQDLQDMEMGDQLLAVQEEQDRAKRELEKLAEEQKKSGMDPIVYRDMLELAQEERRAQEQVQAKNRTASAIAHSQERYELFLEALRVNLDELDESARAQVLQQQGLSPTQIDELMRVVNSQVRFDSVTPPVKAWLNKNSERFRRQQLANLLGTTGDKGVPVVDVGGQPYAVLPQLKPGDRRDIGVRDLWDDAQQSIAKGRFDLTNFVGDFKGAEDLAGVIYTDGALFKGGDGIIQMMVDARNKFGLTANDDSAVRHMNPGALDQLTTGTLMSAPTYDLKSRGIEHKDVVDIATEFSKGDFMKARAFGEGALVDALKERGYDRLQRGLIIDLVNEAITSAEPTRWTRLTSTVKDQVTGKVLSPIAGIPIGDAPVGLALMPLIGPAGVLASKDFVFGDLGLDSIGDVAEKVGEGINYANYPVDKHTQLVAALSIMSQDDDWKRKSIGIAGLASLFIAEAAPAVLIAGGSGGTASPGIIAWAGTALSAATAGSTLATAAGGYTLDDDFVDQLNQYGFTDLVKPQPGGGIGDIYASAILVPGRDKYLAHKIREIHNQYDGPNPDALEKMAAQEQMWVDYAWEVAADPLNLIVPEALLPNGGIRQAWMRRQVANMLVPVTQTEYLAAGRVGARPGQQGAKNLWQTVQQAMPRVKLGPLKVGSEDFSLFSRTTAGARYDLAALITQRTNDMTLVQRVLTAAVRNAEPGDDLRGVVWRTMREFTAAADNPNVDVLANAFKRYNFEEIPTEIDRQFADVGQAIVHGEAGKTNFPSLKKKISPGATEDEQLEFFRNLSKKEQKNYYATHSHFVSEFVDDYIKSAARQLLIRFGFNPEALPAGLKIQQIMRQGAGAFLESPRYVIRNLFSNIVPAFIDDQGLVLTHLASAEKFIDETYGAAAAGIRTVGSGAADEQVLLALRGDKSNIEAIRSMVTGGDGVNSLLFDSGNRPKLSALMTTFRRMGSRLEASFGQALIANGMQGYLRQNKMIIVEDVLQQLEQVADPAAMRLIRAKVDEAKNGADFRQLLKTEIAPDGSISIERTWTVRDLFGDLTENPTIQRFLDTHPEYENVANEYMRDALKAYANNEISLTEAKGHIELALDDIETKMFDNLSNEMAELGISPHVVGDKQIENALRIAQKRFESGEFATEAEAMRASVDYVIAHTNIRDYTRKKLDELYEVARRVNGGDLYLLYHDEHLRLQSEYEDILSKLSDEQDALGITKDLAPHQQERARAAKWLHDQFVEIEQQHLSLDETKRLFDDVNRRYGERIRGLRAEAQGKGKWPKISDENWSEHKRIQRARDEATMEYRRNIMANLEDFEAELNTRAERIFSAQKPFEERVEVVKDAMQGDPQRVAKIADLQTGDRVELAGRRYNVVATGENKVAVEDIATGEMQTFTGRKKGMVFYRGEEAGLARADLNYLMAFRDDLMSSVERAVLQKMRDNTFVEALTRAVTPEEARRTRGRPRKNFLPSKADDMMKVGDEVEYEAHIRTRFPIIEAPTEGEGVRPITRAPETKNYEASLASAQEKLAWDLNARPPRDLAQKLQTLEEDELAALQRFVDEFMPPSYRTASQERTGSIEKVLGPSLKTEIRRRSRIPVDEAVARSEQEMETLERVRADTAMTAADIDYRRRKALQGDIRELSDKQVDEILSLPDDEVYVQLGMQPAGEETVTGFTVRGTVVRFDVSGAPIIKLHNAPEDQQAIEAVLQQYYGDEPNVPRKGTFELKATDITSESAKFKNLTREREAKELLKRNFRAQFTDDEYEALVGLRRRLGLSRTSTLENLPDHPMVLELESQMDAVPGRIQAARSRIGNQVRKAKSPLRGALSREELARMMGGIAPEDMVGRYSTRIWDAVSHRKVVGELTGQLERNLQDMVKPGVKYTPEEAKEIERLFGEAEKRLNIVTREAYAYGTAVRDFALHNYQNTYNFDYLARFIFPWELWMTRSMAKYSMRILDKPWLFSKADIFRDFWTDEVQDNINLPDFYKNKMRLPIPYAGALPEWLAGDIFTSSWSAAVPVEMMTNYQPRDEADTTWGQILNNADQWGIGTHPALTYALRYSGALGPRAKRDIFGTLPYEPLINTLSYLTARVIPGIPADLRYSEADYARTRRVLDKMAVEGGYDIQEILEAKEELAQIESGRKGSLIQIPGFGALVGIHTNNEVLKTAMNRATLERMAATELGWWSSLTLYSYQDADKTIEETIKEWDEIQAREAGEARDAAVKKFFETYPYMNVKFLGGSTPEARLEKAAFSVTMASLNDINEEYDAKIAELTAANPFDPEIDRLNTERFERIDAEWADTVDRTGLKGLRGDLSPFSGADLLKPHEFFAKVVDHITQDKYFTYTDEAGNPYQDATAKFKVQDSFLNSVPQSIRANIEFERRKNDSAAEAVRKTIEDMYFRANDYLNGAVQELVGAERAQKLNELQQNWKPPTRVEIIREIKKVYGDQFTDKELGPLISTTLPTLGAALDVTTETKIAKARESGMGFLAPSGEAVTLANIDTFEEAFTNQKEFYGQLDLGSRYGDAFKVLWDENVELFFGSGRSGAELVRAERAIQTQIVGLTGNSQAQRDARDHLYDLLRDIRAAKDILGVPDEATATFEGIQENLNLLNYLQADVANTVSAYESGKMTRTEFINKVREYTKAGLVVVDGVVKDGEEAKAVTEQRKQAYNNTSQNRTTGTDQVPVNDTVSKLSISEIVSNDTELTPFKNELITKSFQKGDDIPTDETFAYLLKHGASNHNEIQRLFQDMYDLANVDRESDLAREVRRLPHVKSALFGISQLRVRTATIVLAIDDMLKLFAGKPLNEDLGVPATSEFAKTFSKTPTGQARASASAVAESSARSAVQRVGIPATGFGYGVSSWEDVRRVVMTLFGDPKLLDAMIQSFRSGRDLTGNDMRRAKFMATVVPLQGATNFTQWLLGLKLIFQSAAIGAPQAPQAPASPRSRFPLAVRERRF